MRIIEQLDDNEDEFGYKFQKIILLQEIQRIYGEMLIGVRRTVLTESSFEAMNIRKNAQNYPSWCDGLLHEVL